MDTRRVSARARPSGLLDRFKRVFSSPSHISSPESTTLDQKSTMPGSFVSHPPQETSHQQHSTSPSNDTSNVSSPNKLLSDFFAKKGSTPLSEVEYAGVMALVAQADPKRDASDVSTTLNPPTDKLKLSVPQQKLLATRARQPSLSVQRSFRHASANTSISSTFDYTPVNHTFAGSTANPIRRVHRFNGLPLPYRTRIRTPVLGSNANTSLLNTSATSSVLGLCSSNRNDHPLSETAATLRAILDGNAASTNKATVDRFANPYASTRKRRRAPDASALIMPKEEAGTKKQATSVPVESNVPLPVAKANLSAKDSPKVPQSQTFSFGAALNSKQSNGLGDMPEKTLSSTKTLSHNAPTFTFPQPPQEKATVDRKMIDRFKPLYLF